MRGLVALWSGLALALGALAGCNAPFGIDPTLPDSVDPDHDGVADDGDDNCPGIANPDQADGNHDGVGDACSTFCTGTCPDPATCACADLDASTAPPTDWDLTAEGGTTAGVTTGDVRTPPHALNLFAPAGPTAGVRKLVTFSHGLLAPSLHITYETDWKLSYFHDHDATHTVAFISVFLANVANVQLVHTFDGVSGGWLVSVTSIDRPGQSFVIPPPPTDEATWAHVRLDVKFDHGGAGHVYLDFNGIAWLHEDNLTNAPATSGPQTLSALANVWCTQGTNPDVYVTHDNVLVRVD